MFIWVGFLCVYQADTCRLACLCRTLHVEASLSVDLEFTNSAPAMSQLAQGILSLCLPKAEIPGNLFLHSTIYWEALKFFFNIFSCFPSPSSFQILPTSLPTELYVLSLLKTQKPQNRNQTNNKRCQNKTKSRKETMGVVLCWPSTPRLGSALTCGLYPVRLLWRNLIFPFASIYQLQIFSWFVVRPHIHFPLFVLGSPLVELMWFLCLLPQSGGTYVCRSHCVWKILLP